LQSYRFKLFKMFGLGGLEDLADLEEWAAVKGNPEATVKSDTSEQIYISSLALLKMLKHARAGVPLDGPAHRGGHWRLCHQGRWCFRDAAEWNIGFGGISRSSLPARHARYAQANPKDGSGRWMVPLPP